MTFRMFDMVGFSKSEILCINSPLFVNLVLLLARTHMEEAMMVVMVDQCIMTLTLS